MTTNYNKITILAGLMIFIMSLSGAQGFNGFGDKSGGREDIRREHDRKLSAPARPRQPDINTQGRERRAAPGIGLTKPSAPDPRNMPKLDAVKPPRAQSPGDGYKKPSAPSGNQSIRPEAAKPTHYPKPPTQHLGPSYHRQVKPPVAEQPGQKPHQPVQGTHVSPGAAAPMHGIPQIRGQEHLDRPSPEQMQDFLKLRKPAAGPPSKPSFGKIGAAAVGAAAGAVALDHFVNRVKRAHGTEEFDREHYPKRRPDDSPQYNASHLRQAYSHRYRQVFDEPWMMHHSNLKPYYWHSNVWPHRPWNYWWRPVTWAVLTSWIPWNWTGPIYYDYGNNFHYDRGNVIYNGQRLCRADEYYIQAVKLVSNIPAVRDDPEQWMPVGVFALKPAAGEASDMILQMAVNKDGIIEGTYYNATNDTAKPIRGIVERKSQRAIWTFSDDQNHSVILETGIYNLTQDETKVLVHFGRHRTEEWLLVRLQEPQA